LPSWFLDAVNRRCGDRPRREITDELNAVSGREFSLSSVYDFLAGKVTTKHLMGAFLVMFPDLPPPVFYAESEEESRRIQELRKLYSPPPGPRGAGNTPKLTETIEDTGEKSRTSDRERTSEKTRSGERVQKRTK
jgi:hypothetical protein